MDAIAKTTPTGNDLLKNGPKLPPTPPIINIPEPKLGKDEAKAPEAPLKIALIGTAPSSRDLAPYNDTSWTIWACSPGNMGIIPRVDAWFEVHSNLLWPEHAAYGPNYVNWLKQQTFPVYMQDRSIVPNATPLPIQELVKEFGKYFFTSSFAYMLAMAMRAGAQEIALFGIDMASKDEYILQRPGGHYFMQKAAEKGIKVSVPYESDLAQPPPLYGYVDSTPFGRKIYVRQKELKDRIAGMKAQRDQLNHSITYLEGALEDLSYITDVWTGLQT